MKYGKRLILLAGFALIFTGCGDTREVYFTNGDTTEHMTPVQTESGSEAAANTEAEKPGQKLCVYVCGAVESPGVYRLDRGSRIYEAVACAGGFREDAGRDALNLAEEISDEQMIRIPTAAEAEEIQQNTQQEQEEKTDGRVNLNRATTQELMLLPGIGESKAESIIAFRQEHGDFLKTEDIMQITGIKEGVYSKIKDRITVD